ncbi:MAG: endonuclease Q family protein [archaeon]
MIEERDEKKELFADLHIHSRFSRACSKELTIPNLVKWARVKGIGLLGTGDFTHNVWLSELKELKEENGILWFEDEIKGSGSKDTEEKGKFPFILTSEISLVYTDKGKGRRVHLVYFAPSLESVDKINSWLDGIGRRDYDGRPIFKITCRDFVAKMQEIDDKIEVIPAHIWTPWFGLFGSKGGYDNLKDAFEDKLDRIHAIETGISSDPGMNWRIKELADKNIGIVSFSDSHSFWPWRLGREVTIFKLKDEEGLSYDMIVNQIRENSFIGTIETDPAYGMYHFDGHRNCNFSCSPEKTKELKGICPKCGKGLTVGVDYRVDELASDESNYENKKKYYTLLPLHEILSLGLGVGMNTKKCWDVYNKLIEKFENEFNILLKVSKEELKGVLDNELLVDLILKNRKGEINVKPGYDGVYGEAVLDEEDKQVSKKRIKENIVYEKQKKLF